MPKKPIAIIHRSYSGTVLSVSLLQLLRAVTHYKVLIVRLPERAIKLRVRGLQRGFRTGVSKEAAIRCF